MSDLPDLTYGPRFDTVSHAAPPKATKIRVGGKVKWQPHDLAYVSTRDTSEVLLVLKVAPKTLTVRRGVGGDAHPIASGADLLLIGRAA